MKEKMFDLGKMFAFGLISAILCTCVIYFFFPQYLCYAVFAVNTSDLYQKEDRDIYPGAKFVEYFSPQSNYLTGIGINVLRENREDVVVGRLLDDRQRVLAESQFTLQDVSYEFEFNKWVKPGERYLLEIVFPEENENAITTTFGPVDIGPNEHVALYVGDNQMEEALYTRYIYGTYSKKLLAFWFLVFFLCGMVVGETIINIRRPSGLNQD